MGCFDEVTFRCPKCGAVTIQQTKAGDCSMSMYALEEAPPEIVAALAHDAVYCEKCDYLIHFTLITKPKAIAY